MYEVMNGKATALRKTGSYSAAIRIYDSLLATNLTDQSRLARIIDNRAITRWLQNGNYPALPELRAALKIRTDSQYIQGLNASYTHLTEYYAKTKRDSALWYANKMYTTANEIHNAKDILEAIDKLVSLNSSSARKEYWYQEYKVLNDSLQLAKDNHRNRFALIRYGVQKSKADNLLLQQDISRQRLLLYGLMAFATVTIAGLSIWYNKRKKRIKQESENAIRDAKLRTSQKVHDVVANGLYRIMNELEHGQSIDSEPLMTRIEELYERSRNISYEETSDDTDVDYDNQVHELINDYTNEQTKVFVVGNQPSFWNKITGNQKTELLLVLNEIMVNMKKHSGANSVVIRFMQENNKGYIYYSDNGRGFSPAFKFGNGLKNTVSRIKSLKGEINFGKSGTGGASVMISFPLEADNL